MSQIYSVTCNRGIATTAVSTAVVLILILTVAWGQPPPETPEPDKTLILALRCFPHHISVRNALVKDIPYRTAPRQGNYRYSLLAGNDALLYTGSFGDPHDILLENFSNSGHPISEKGRREIAEITLKIPYFTNARHIQFQRQEEASGEWIDLGTSRLVVSK